MAIDATVLVINCGNYERVGIRHRATQTLYLSNLIDVTKAENRSYLKIHLGLQLSIVDDAIDRYRQSQALKASSTARKRKRRDPTIPTRTSSRQAIQRLKARVMQDPNHTNTETKVDGDHRTCWLVHSFTIINCGRNFNIVHSCSSCCNTRPSRLQAPLLVFEFKGRCHLTALV